MKLLKHLSSLVLFWAVFSSAAQETQSLVLPGEYENEEHPSWSLDPFNSPPHRAQYMYYADNFVEAMPEGGIITAIAFRLDGPFGAPSDRSSVNTVVPAIEIRASTTPSLEPVISLEFARNIGVDETVIHSRGPLALMSAWDPEGPNHFSLIISFENPFIYNPNQGHLLLDFFTYEIAGERIVIDSGGGEGDLQEGLSENLAPNWRKTQG